MGVSENGVYGIPLKWLFQWQTDDESLNSGVPYFQTKTIPSGKRLHSELERSTIFYSWVNTHYFDWDIYQFAFGMFTRPGNQC